MTIGTGIFLASIVLGAVGLFGITKDRWNWPRLLKRVVLGSICLIAIVAGGFYVWMAITKANERAEAKRAQEREERAQERENKARTCIAGQLPQMESIARAIRAEVREDMRLDAVKTMADKVAGSAGQIVPSNDTIKERVLIYSIHTPCDSPFNLLVNVRANEAGELRWLKVWANDPPKGYAEGLLPDFSVDFEEMREFKAQMQLEAQAHAARARQTAVAKEHEADTDPCAPGLSQHERLSRLAKFGKVRQTAERNYEAGGHEVVLFDDGSLIYCR
jgi:hypothetical protein